MGWVPIRLPERCNRQVQRTTLTLSAPTNSLVVQSQPRAWGTVPEQPVFVSDDYILKAIITEYR